MGDCDTNVVTVEEMEVDSGPAEVYYPLKVYCVILILKDAVPEYRGTLTLTNSKVYWFPI